MSKLGKAVVTGASSGIGAVYAEKLAKRGYDLILVARDEGRLHDLSKKLASETGQQIEVIRADLTQKDDLLQIEKILQSDSKISLLVNNAGAAVTGRTSDSEPDKLENLIALNVTSVVRLSRAVLPAFIQCNTGSIINISSAVAYIPSRISTTYSATKAFILNFTQGLQEEFKDNKNLYIQVVLPGAIATEIWDRSGTSVNMLPKEAVMKTDDLVSAALVGFDKKELVTIPSLPDLEEWKALESARLAISTKLSLSKPAQRYSY